MVLKNTTIINAKSDNGGAIKNQGTLTITQSTFANKTANKRGGAIINYETLNITESTLANNTASYGGAIYSTGHANITDNTFTNNTAYNTETIDLPNMNMYTSMPMFMNPPILHLKALS